MEIAPNYATPVLFLIFNRPDSTYKVFEEIKKIKPTKLYIAADGPRQHIPGEREKCSKAREIKKSISWKCELKTLFRDDNLGCKYAVSSAINWFFSQEEEGIILEDDCVPNQTFFSFCEYLLKTYRDNDQIMHIGGSNFQFDLKRDSSYYFSNYNHVWGWATWRRAWKKYDRDMAGFPEFFKKNKIDMVLGKNSMKYSWLYKFWKCYYNKIDTWDYQWTFSIWQNQGISITPTSNLVSNIGFDENATHTKTRIENISHLQTKEIDKIIHPETTEVNVQADKITEKISYKKHPLKNIFFMVFMKMVRYKLHEK